MPGEPTKLMVLPRSENQTPGTERSGMVGGILGLNLDTTRGAIIQSLLEAMAYFFAVGRDTLEQTGMRVERCRATGGGARSAVWLQLSADVLGVPIERTRFTHPAALGAAMIAGVGAGTYGSYAEATRAQVKIDHVFAPNEQRHELYEKKVGEYKRLRQLLAKKS